MNTIGKLKDQLNRKHAERDVVRKKYLEMRIEEAGNELKNLEAKISCNPFPSRPNVLVQPPVEIIDDNYSIAGKTEFSDATKVTDNLD